MTQSKDDRLQCPFCGNSYTERRLFSHMCEAKRRYDQRNDKAVQLGYGAFKQFYQRSMRGKVPTYDDFAKSAFYSEFVHFGKHLLDIRAIKPMAFVDFLLRAQIKSKDWTKLTYYTKYVCELTKSELPQEAIDRNFDLMKSWALDHPGEDWKDFFRRIEPPLAVLWIISGRISPWIVFTARSANDLMDRFTAEETRKVYEVIDVKFWELKMERHKDEVARIRDEFDKLGI